ncbi:MAG TPA: hypothetical protein DCS04_00815 [Ruminococcaceae bacterium]|nr:hypothetical protein [Oscillospiraceae bacterium]
MKNKILLRVISLVMAASVVFAVGGCGKKDTVTDDTTAESKAQEVIDGKGNAVQPSIDKDGKAVIKYTKVNSEGKKEDATTVVNVNSSVVNKPTMGSSLSDTVKTDGQKKTFVDNLVKKDDVDKDKAEDIINKAEDWVEFGYSVYVANTNALRLITASIEIGSKNDNLILHKNLDCEYSIKSGSGMEIYISGLVNLAKYPDDQALLKELNAMNVKLVYTLAEDSITDIDDWSKVTTKTMDIKF